MPDAFDIEGENFFLAVCYRRAHDQLVLVKDLHQVGEHQFALHIIGVDLPDIGTQRRFLEGEDTGVDLARLEQFPLAEGINAAIVDRLIRGFRIQAEDILVFHDLDGLVSVLTRRRAVDVRGGHADDAAVVVGYRRAAVEAGEHHHIA